MVPVGTYCGNGNGVHCSWWLKGHSGSTSRERKPVVGICAKKLRHSPVTRFLHGDGERRPHERETASLLSRSEFPGACQGLISVRRDPRQPCSCHSPSHSHWLGPSLILSSVFVLLPGTLQCTQGHVHFLLITRASMSETRNPCKTIPFSL